MVKFYLGHTVCGLLQVVLRKARHLREHPMEIAKSSIGQDHAYVRSDHAAQRISTSFDGLEALVEAISYRESEADVSNGSFRFTCSGSKTVHSFECGW